MGLESDTSSCPLVTPPHSVMLALSTFRQSSKAINLAIEKAKKSRKLVVVYVVDVNLARYLIGSEVGFYPELKEKCEADLLKEHEIRAKENVASIVKLAQEHGIDVEAHVKTGRFALECLEAIKKERPELVVTTRSKRPTWVKKFFGSPVDHLIANTSCPVVQV